MKPKNQGPYKMPILERKWKNDLDLVKKSKRHGGMAARNLSGGVAFLLPWQAWAVIALFMLYFLLVIYIFQS